MSDPKVSEMATNLSLWQKIKASLAYQGLRPFVIGHSCCSPAISLADEQVAECLVPDFMVNLRDANLIIVSGIVTPEQRPYLEQAISTMRKPYYTLAVGNCSLGSTDFATMPLDQLIKVDAHVAGCPPTAESIVEAIERLEKMSRDEFLCR